MYSDLPHLYWELNEWNLEFERVLKVFWSPIPLGKTHNRYTNASKSIKRKMNECLF